MPYGKAILLFQRKAAQRDLLVEMVAWKLPQTTIDRPEQVKYRLYLGREGRTLIRYDNETGKGHHRHVGPEEIEEAYEFISLETLFADFRADCERHGWRWTDEEAPGRSDER